MDMVLENISPKVGGNTNGYFNDSRRHGTGSSGWYSS